MTDYTHLLDRLHVVQSEVTLSNAHRYRADGDYRPGVTTVIGVLDAPALTRWKIKAQVSGTGRAAFANPPQENEPEAAYISRLERLAAEGLEHERISDEAAKVGSGVHALIETHVKRLLGETLPDPVVPEEALYRFSGWADWARRVGLVPLASESRMYSAEHGFCGSLDLLCTIEGELGVVDAKPQASVYASRRLQLAAYRLLLTGLGWPVMRGYLNVLPRDGGEITLVEVDQPGPELDASTEAFLRCLSLYRWSAAHEKAQRRVVRAR